MNVEILNLLSVAKLETIISIHYLKDVVKVALNPLDGIKDFEKLFEEIKENHNPHQTTAEDILHLIACFVVRGLGEDSSGSSRSSTPTFGVAMTRLETEYSGKTLIGKVLIVLL